uniref:Reverse transcriptase Ty1/copia-type domain-containing protein n=1 Tax=Solanum lycopersicum TaxID=4081 RepID=A0A3Q7EX49_SOLLC
MDGCNHILTAAASSSKLSSSDGTLFHDETLYSSTVGALQYLTFTPFAVNKVSQLMHSPREFHWAAVKRILRYIQSISSHGLFFARQNTKLLHSYSDVNWGGSLDYRKSTTDFAIFLGSHLISSASKKQRAVARSSTEAEYRALANTASELT